eukprot:TRINITY_DN22029_c0_g1_i1.p1 TRINITY_DN22029_c0_g1~~TRINITY_DN22029_c0_g1_i1.p1  ORF type:complete len:151 (+),score=3.52 TRINITY_DN22029_c0_g1_i1:53-505(+)
MDIDDYFRRPGTIPFKWEIQPGIPKTPPLSPSPKPQLLSPPPAEMASALMRSQSSRSRSCSPSTSRHFVHHKLERSTKSSPCIVSPGCFPVRSIKRNGEKKKSDSESRSRTLTRQVTPIYLVKDSPPSLLATRSSLQAVDEVEWAAYGLF